MNKIVVEYGYGLLYVTKLLTKSNLRDIRSKSITEDSWAGIQAGTEAETMEKY